MCNIKKGLRDRARELRGLANALTYDTECVYEDVESYDLMCLGESIHDMKVTLQHLIDGVTELEYQLYLLKRDA